MGLGKRWVRAGLLLVIAAAACGGVLWGLRASLPEMDAELRLSGLRGPVIVEFDKFGIPRVTADSRPDAFRVLGYVTARDRLFQMELIRRQSGGRLAELFGEHLLDSDIRQRVLGFERIAPRILMRLSAEQRELLRAYAEGVNSSIAGQRVPPFEFLMLGHHPEPWRPEDSVLVALAMFQRLNGRDQDERMLTVMEKTLPPEVVAFLTPDTDGYTRALLGGEDSPRPERPIPAKALETLVKAAGAEPRGAWIRAEPPSLGSNNWAVNGSKTADGRAILANDMHLPLEVPNIWYRALIDYGDVHLAGVTLPGVPALVVGSNGRIAWGFTNTDGDLLDLVLLEINPSNPDQYKTPEGWRSFETMTESIAVKRAETRTLTVRSTVWGPVAPGGLAGQTVAIRWTALDPEAVNMGLLEMDRAQTLEAALAVMNQVGGPPQNVVLADARGRIAWTYMGKFPLRHGFDGSASRSWADGRIGWRGYIPAEELPRLIDPPSGFIATANNRTLGLDYPYTIGHNYSNSYRVHRISERLREMQDITEGDLLALQLDTVSRFFDFYRDLAWSALDARGGAPSPLLLRARAALGAWNGRADVDSRGLALLARFRQALADSVFRPYLKVCRELDEDFEYAWRAMDTPLRALLTRKLPETLPVSSRYGDWDGLILAALTKSAAELEREFPAGGVDSLRWAQANRVDIVHPLSRAIPLLGRLLDYPQTELAGCRFCVRVMFPVAGASQRMVVSPSAPQDGIFHMPGGQSGHPLSPNYADQHRAWAEGLPLPFLPGPAEHRLQFLPAD